jgi:outer membrane protein assembly factor BamB
MIHEVRLYRQTLPAAQINRQYRAKKNLFPQSLKFAVEPYLQFDSPHTAIVRWSTKDPSPSLLRVRLGDEFNTIQDAIPKTEHQLGIEVPRHNRIYRYQIEAAVDGVRQLSREYECDTFFNYCVAELPNAPNSFPASDSKNHIASEAKKILAGSKVRQGVCLMLGCTDGQLAYELVRQSKLRVIAVDTDKSRVQALREHFRQAHCYGARVAVHHVESLAKLPWVGAFANLVVSERFMSEGALPGSAAEIMRILRPGGGVACLGQPKSDSKHNSADDLRKWLADSKVEGVNIVSNNRGIWARIVRAPLPGVGEWSHQYGTADNTAFGGETLQGNSNTQDFATHWIGRPGPRAQPDRNGRKPSPLAVNGRLFVQGLHRIIGLDSYNGTILWSQEIPNIERFNLPRDSSNWCADNDFVYVAVGRDCRQINAQTGELVSQRRVADKGNSTSSHQWGYIGRVADKLIGSAIKEGTAFIDFWGGDTAGWYDARSGPVTYKVCSDRLFAMDRSNPGVQWTYEDGVIINSTISGRGNQLYFVECRNKAVKDSDARRVGSKELWQDQFLVALDVSSGKKVWEQPLDTVAGTVVFYMACGEDALVIVASSGEHFHVYAYGRNNGNPIWSNSGGWLEGKGDHGKAMSRPAIVGGEVYVRPWVFDLASGKKLDVPMQGGGCGTYAATSQGLIYRSGNVTLWDRASGNLSSWSRLRPGCWLSTIPASGMVLSPEAGGGCSCGSWLETSVGFMPKLD